MIATKKIVYAIGLMSGTSADGIDGVVLKIEKNALPKIHSVQNLDYPQGLQKKIRKLISRKITHADQSEGLDDELAQLYAQVVTALIEKAGKIKISMVGCHGQTIHHSPSSDPPFSLQLGNGESLAQLINLPVVSNFRTADILAGGQGAPLAPAFHHAVFASPEHHRCVVNIGGISNITLLPGDDPDQVIGFDTGPGNTLMDYWCRTQFKCNFDNNGEFAKSGHIQLDLLALLLDDPYFTSAPPKSTGLEYFNKKWLNDKMHAWDGMGFSSNSDILTTLTALTAQTIANQINLVRPAVESAFISGGGAKNTVIMGMIREYTKINVVTTTELGIDPQWVEAAAFAWMAHRTLNGVTSTLPSVTGATQPTVAGDIHQP